jgi:hypothetical protein
MKSQVIRENTKSTRNGKIIRRYKSILKRMGDIQYLTPRKEIYEEIAEEFNIRPTTVRRILSSHPEPQKKAFCEDY